MKNKNAIFWLAFIGLLIEPFDRQAIIQYGITMLCLSLICFLAVVDL